MVSANTACPRNGVPNQAVSPVSDVRAWFQGPPWPHPRTLEGCAMLPAWTLVSDCIMSWEMSVFWAAGAAAVKSLKSSMGICPAAGDGGCNIAGVGTDAAAGASAAAGCIGTGAAATGCADDVKLPNSSSFGLLLANDAGGGTGATGRAGAACAAACTAGLGELNSESIKCGLGAGRSKSAAVNCADASKLLHTKTC